MKTIIPKLLLAAATMAAAMCFEVPASWAYGDAPWCAVVDEGTGNVVYDCEYRTVEECVPHVLAGNRGFCNLNPYGPGPGWSAPPPEATPRYRHHRRHMPH